MVSKRTVYGLRQHEFLSQLKSCVVVIIPSAIEQGLRGLISSTIKERNEMDYDNRAPMLDTKALIKNQTYTKGEIKSKIVSCVSQSNQTCPSVMS